MTSPFAPDPVAANAPFIDDGIPVLTEVVDVARFPAHQADAAESEPEAMESPEGPPSLSMFPELDPDLAVEPKAHPPEEIAMAPAFVADIEPALDPAPPFGRSANDPGPESMAPRETDIAQSYMALAYLDDPPGDDESAPPMSQGLAREHGDEQAFGAAPPDSPGRRPDASAATLPDYAAGHGSDRPASGPVADQAAISGPAAAGAQNRRESAVDMETRIFEALAARMDRLLDERLDAMVPGVVEASLAGIKAGLAASVRRALRESIERAIRDEFERGHGSDG